MVENPPASAGAAGAMGSMPEVHCSNGTVLPTVTGIPNQMDIVFFFLNSFPMGLPIFSF